MNFIVNNGNLNATNANFSNQTPHGGFNLKANNITWDKGSVNGGGILAWITPITMAQLPLAE